MGGIQSASANQVLDQILIRSSHLRNAQMIPIVVMDLDETSISSTKRRFLSYQKSVIEFCGEYVEDDYSYSRCGSLINFINMPTEKFMTTYSSQFKNEYDPNVLFKIFGPVSDHLKEKINKRMLEIYLSSLYMSLDVSYFGQSDYIRSLRRAGAQIFFVSSRYSDTQLEATYQSLLQNHFFEVNEVDLMKRRVILRKRGQDSLEFKKQAFGYIESIVQKSNNRAQVIATFENEPENMNAMIDLWPQATAVFLKGAYIKAIPLNSKAKIIGRMAYRQYDSSAPENDEDY